MISGLPVVDIEDLKDNVIYKNFTKQSPTILWLWEVLEELNNSERAEFI
jgi:E3 ubiquitin-protein ligase HUWE1